MALLERVARLIRANINDLVDKAEDPEKMVKQVILDMQNQYMQVKTQVAIALADLHLLEKKKNENLEKESGWMKKAELAVEKKQDDLARAALERSMSTRQLAKNFDEQLTDQRTQVELLRKALHDLDMKIGEAQAKADVLVAQHRRSKAVGRAMDANTKAVEVSHVESFRRMEHKVAHEDAVSHAKVELAVEDVERQFEVMEREQEVDRLLQEIKARKSLTA
jgi:phage shock protein A